MLLLVDPRICFGTEPWLIKLGDHVEVTANVTFLSHEGALWCVRWIKSELKEHDMFKPTVVGNNVMIGTNSLIMPGVNIGNNVIIAGHSVVTKDIEDGMIVAGVPAKPISTVEKFVSKISEMESFPTKPLNSDQKREYLRNRHPEWFQ